MHRTVRFLISAGIAVAPLLVAGPASAGGGGCHERTGGADNDRRGTTVELSRNCMKPAVLRADAGEGITFVNVDPVAHNITAPGLYQDLPPGESFTKRIYEPGVYAFSCTLHVGMTGAVVIGDADPPVASIAASPAVQASDAGGRVLWWPTAGAAGLAVVAGAAGYTAGRRRRSEWPADGQA